MGQHENLSNHGSQANWGQRSPESASGGRGDSDRVTPHAIAPGDRPIPPQANGLRAGATMDHWAEGAGPAKGPFSPAINAVLSASFGQSLDGITVARGEGHKNRGIGAEAHTIGKKISLGSEITEDQGDARSLEIIGHEVSHALAGGGAGRTLLDKPGDPGEAVAYDAGRQLRNFAMGGGPLPRLSPAFGGQAAIHRYEGGEHKDSVDNAVKTLQDEGVTVDKNVAAQMSKKIKLGNGLVVDPGDITAMMGDFYGAFDTDKDGKDHFNPEKSFNALFDPKADPVEMQKILDKIHREYGDVQKAKEGKGKFEATATSEFDEVTENRTVTKDKDGTKTGYQFLELAKRNANHFNKEDPTNPDSNMGSYDVLHRLALKAAADGDENKARAMEASAQHFLTDRFAAGHQFDKDKIIAAGGGGIPGQIMSRFVHNVYNKNGVQMSDADGNKWTGRGDEHWADKENKDNRVHAAQTTVESYSELEAVLSGKKKPEDVQKDSKVGKMVPQWSQKNEKVAEFLANPLIAPHVPGFDKFIIDEGSDMLKEKGHDLKKWAGNKWDGIKGWAGEKWQGAKDWAGEKWQGAKDWAGEKWQGAKDWAGEKWQGAKDWAGEKWQGAKDWAGEKWQGAKDMAGQAKDWGKQQVQNAKAWGHQEWEGAKETAGEVKDWAGQKWQGAKQATKETVSEVKDKASSAWGWLKKKVSGD